VFGDIGSVGMDVWQVKSGTIFDNIFISDSVSEAESFLAESYNKQKEKDAFDAYEKKKKEEEEATKKTEEPKDVDDDDHHDHPHDHHHEDL